MDVVVVGSCMIDLMSYVPRLPVAGETLHGTRFVVGFGGKGANQCVAAKKLGCSAQLIASLGADSFGNDYRTALDRLGISTSFVKSCEDFSSGMASIIVDDKGENQIVIVAGANNALGEEDVEKARNEIEKAKVLITQMEVPSETTKAALKIKSNSQGISILNVAPAQKHLDPELYGLPTIFCTNETETETLIGQPLKSVQDAENAAAILQTKGCQHIIITLGAQGALYAPPNQKPIHVPSIPVKVVDTTGAGDAFIGALGFFLSTRPELPWEESIRRSCVVAAYSVQKPGTQTSFPTLDQLQESLLL